jgi:hypothetical protein
MTNDVDADEIEETNENSLKDQLTPSREWLLTTENTRDWFGEMSGRSNNQDWDDIFQQIHLHVQQNSDLVELLDEFDRDGWPKADICHAILGSADDDEGDDSESTPQDEDDVSFFSVGPPMKKVRYEEAIPVPRTSSEKRLEIATKLGNALDLHRDVALAVLPAFRWILTDAIEKFVAGDQNQIFHELGLSPSSLGQELFMTEVPDGVCGSCKRKETCLKLHCQHTFCGTCWRKKIRAVIGARQTQVTCIHHRCNVRLMESDVRSRCTGCQLDIFEELLLDEFVRHCPMLKRCPSCSRDRLLCQNALGPIDIVTAVNAIRTFAGVACVPLTDTVPANRGRSGCCSQFGDRTVLALFGGTMRESPSAAKMPGIVRPSSAMPF